MSLRVRSGFRRAPILRGFVLVLKQQAAGKCSDNCRRLEPADDLRRLPNAMARAVKPLLSCNHFTEPGTENSNEETSFGMGTHDEIDDAATIVSQRTTVSTMLKKDDFASSFGVLPDSSKSVRVRADREVAEKLGRPIVSLLQPKPKTRFRASQQQLEVPRWTAHDFVTPSSTSLVVVPGRFKLESWQIPANLLYKVGFLRSCAHFQTPQPDAQLDSLKTLRHVSIEQGNEENIEDVDDRVLAVGHSDYELQKPQLTANQKLQRCCHKRLLSPRCAILCNFDTFTDSTLVTAILTMQCPGEELRSAFTCASSRADHVQCCLNGGIGQFFGGHCMPLCRENFDDTANIIQFLPCLQVIKNCYQFYKMTSPE